MRGGKKTDSNVGHAHPVGCDIGGAGSAFAQSNPFMPKMSLGGQEKKALTPEEQERQKQIDDAYRAATNKIPNQSANDPWATVRPAPAAPAPKKKPQ